MQEREVIVRSEVWQHIFNIVSKIPRKVFDGDLYVSIDSTTELEELFLQFLNKNNSIFVEGFKEGFNLTTEKLNKKDFEKLNKKDFENLTEILDDLNK